MVAVLLTVCCFTSCGLRRANYFLILQTYRGWVDVEFGTVGEPKLPMEKGHFLITVPASGKLSTGSPLVSGYANDRYYFLNTLGARTEIPFDLQGCQTGVCISHVRYVWQPKEAAIFFVGSEVELSRFPETP